MQPKSYLLFCVAYKALNQPEMVKQSCEKCLEIINKYWKSLGFEYYI